jgi:hypothetical protein
MTPGAVWLASFLVPAVCGLPAVWALRNLTRICRLALGTAMGMVVLSTVMTAESLLGWEWRVWVLVVLSLASSALLGLWIRPAAAPPFRDPSSRRPGAWLRLVGALLAAAAVTVVAISVIEGASTSADAIMIWGPKSQFFALARKIDPVILRDPALWYMQSSYPPLVTNLSAFASMCAGRMAWGAFTATFPLFLAVLALALPGLLRGTAQEPMATAVSALVVAGIGLMGMEADIAGNGEMAMLLFDTLAMAILVRRDAALPAMQVVGGVLLAGAASSKVEGFPFAIAAIAGFLALRADVRGKVRAFARLFTPTLICTALWFGYGALNRLFLGYDTQGRSATVYPAVFPEVLAAIGHFLWRVGYAMPYLIPLVFLILRPRPFRPAMLPLAVAAVLVGFFLFAYLHSSEPYLWIGWTASRIFSPLIPLFAIAGGAGTASEFGPRAAAE